MVIRAAVALLLAAASDLPARDEADPVIVCFGDSITLRGYPAELGRRLNVPVANAGVGGHTTAAALRRLQRDVIARKPKVVVVLFGTNDSRLDAPKVHVPVERYRANLHAIVDACRAIGARVVLCTLPPINAEPYFTRHARPVFDAAGGLAAVLESYRAAALRLAAEQSVAVVDLHARLAERPQWLSPDGVHPSPEGNGIIAELVAAAVQPLLADAPGSPP